ncbi:hypothetical protein AMK26_24765 [Streptomyces sp. CB03234]|uniref:hypothetical protein n=1 Tax=Streptomyces sp. (strain CB03234) TaxID=1703937 RepID=UPI00093D5F21|nr:hypothetical protein [Streptomyces sp. CB03234]OKK02788.1 hypothetical protein AMK26_24765 [Streptomyces sp. CB03234]
MPFEDDVSEAMHRTGETFITDHRAIVEGGLRRGQARVMRRRAAVGAAAVMALTGSVFYGGWLLGTSPAQEVVTGNGPSPDVTLSGTPNPRMNDPDQHIRVSADQMIQILERVLPKGKLTQQRGTSNFGDPNQAADASLVYDDGFGEALVEVSIKRADIKAPANRKLVVCPKKLTPPAISCHSEPWAGGSATVVSEDKGLRTSRSVSLSEEGYLVELTTFNGLPKEGRATRAHPPFTEMQTSNLIGMLNSAMTKYGIPNPDLFTREVRVSGSLAVMERLQRLSPKGLSPRGGGGDGATGYIIAYDVKNKTKSHLRATLTPKGAPGDGEPRWSETLPDGTRIATSERPAKGKGVTEWRVDALRPNGLRVTITSYNAEYPHRDANRTTPPATMEQLKAVAVHDSWLTLK